MTSDCWLYPGYFLLHYWAPLTTCLPPDYSLGSESLSQFAFLSPFSILFFFYVCLYIISTYLCVLNGRNRNKFVLSIFSQNRKPCGCFYFVIITSTEYCLGANSSCPSPQTRELIFVWKPQGCAPGMSGQAELPPQVPVLPHKRPLLSPLTAGTVTHHCCQNYCLCCCCHHHPGPRSWQRLPPWSPALPRLPKCVGQPSQQLSVPTALYPPYPCTWALLPTIPSPLMPILHCPVFFFAWNIPDLELKKLQLGNTHRCWFFF